MRAISGEFNAKGPQKWPENRLWFAITDHRDYIFASVR